MLNEYTSNEIMMKLINNLNGDEAYNTIGLKMGDCQINVNDLSEDGVHSENVNGLFLYIHANRLGKAIGKTEDLDFLPIVITDELIPGFMRMLVHTLAEYEKYEVLDSAAEAFYAAILKVDY